MSKITLYEVAAGSISPPATGGVSIFLDAATSEPSYKDPAGNVESLKGDTGATGPAGADGADGADGAPGVGVPTGGTAGQYLRKVSSTDFDTAFATIATSEVNGLDTALAGKADDADITALDARIDALESAPPAHTHAQADITDLVGDLSDIDSRLDQLELGSPPPEAQGTWLASGGLVAYISGLTFRVSPATYYINGVQYSSPQTDITLDAADPTDERFDAIALTTSSTAVKVTGVAASDPAFPNIDPETQLALTYVHVNAGATDPGITLTDIYKEDAEWTSSVSGGTFNAGSTTDPFAGTKSIEATAAAANDFVRLTNGATISLNDKKQVTINIKSKASWPNQKSVQVTWYAAGVKKGQSVAIGNNKFGFVSTNTTSYQQIVLPISAFAVPAADVVDRLELKVAGGGGTIGFFADNIILETNAGTVTPPSVGAATATTLGLVRTDITDANPQVYLKTSVDTLLAAKSNTGHTHSQADVTNLVTDLADLDTRIDALEAAPPGYTDENAQDAVGAMVDSSLNYVDGTPLLQRAALTGDVTAAAGSNATTIANDAVTTAKILNSNVTLAKIQNIATSKLLGRSTAGSGVIEELSLGGSLQLVSGTLHAPDWLLFALSDESTALTTGVKLKFRLPACTILDLRSSVGTAPTGANLILDVKENGTTILSTLLSIDAGESTSTTAGTPAVISDASIADDAEITVEITQVGSTIAGAGLKLAIKLRYT